MADYSTLTDQELIFLLKQREELAFTEIYRRHWHVLYLHAWKMLNDKDEAKDMVQDLYFAFWEKSGALDIKTNLKGYLYRGLKNKILNYIRSKNTKRRTANCWLLKMCRDTTRSTRQWHTSPPTSRTLSTDAPVRLSESVRHVT